MKTISIKWDKNHKPIIDGDFEFKIGKIIYNPKTLQPKSKISFDWNVEMPQDIIAFKNNEYCELYEAIGEKLKRDFIKHLKGD
jgi:hypothetical protein